MNPKLNVYALPSLVQEEELAQGVVVVIDVLRASTTIVHALEAGAKEILICGEVDEARNTAENLPSREVVLGGEREGLPIEGFDLGNSPTEYVPASVEGKSIVFTTSNGTRAMLRCRKAQKILIGSFVNATAIYEQLVGQERVHLLCAGTLGQFSRDDVLMAGLLVERLTRSGAGNHELNVQAVTARENWTSSFAVPYTLGAEPFPPELLAAELRKSDAGRRLTAIGREDDILTASMLDRFSIVPILDPAQMRITGLSH